ncbi:MAG: hypothetical protein WBX22_11160 [Silvibacterium sp.]
MGVREDGYFPGIELSDQPPLLYLVAPALRIWEMIGLNRRLEEAHKGHPARAMNGRPANARSAQNA